MMIMISSYCGIDCGICDQYINTRCPGCFKSDEKKRCRIPDCTTDRNVKSCLDCIRLDYCKKRRSSIEECIVFFPRQDISLRRPYLIDDVDRNDALNIFFRHVYDGADGLMVHFDVLEEKWGYMLGDVKRVEGVYELEEIQNVISDFLEENYNPTIFIDSLRSLKEKNPLPNVLDFLNMINKMAASKNGLVFIVNDLDSEKGVVVNYMADIVVESMLKAVSNPQRKDILRLLSKRGKSSFKELIDELDYYLPSKLSFHLKLLKDTEILEQDRDGIYYISPIGREFDKLIDRMASLSASNIQLHPSSGEKLEHVSDFKSDGYRRYLRGAKKSGNFQFVNLVNDIEKSLGTYYGGTQTKDVLMTTLGDYIKSEKTIDKKGLRRLVSEIVFVYLVDTMPLDKAISWADEMIAEHCLN